jgi:hypothetical protein
VLTRSITDFFSVKGCYEACGGLASEGGGVPYDRSPARSEQGEHHQVFHQHQLLGNAWQFWMQRDRFVGGWGPRCGGQKITTEGDLKVINAKPYSQQKSVVWETSTSMAGETLSWYSFGFSRRTGNRAPIHRHEAIDRDVRLNDFSQTYNGVGFGFRQHGRDEFFQSAYTQTDKIFFLIFLQIPVRNFQVFCRFLTIAYRALYLISIWARGGQSEIYGER